jgi:hypothetical protein
MGIMIRQNYTATVERNRVFEGEVATEPYECGWASEAIFFVRKLEAAGPLAGAELAAQISADGIHWCNSGAVLALSGAEVDFVRVTHFGNFLRLAGRLPEGARMRVIVSLSLKE